jgi:two-component system chemotaxis response regulator CheY
MQQNERIKILIVDDLDSMRQEFGAICREFVPDARIDEATDVVHAMELLQKEMPIYDVVFTDINMPNISGLKLISFIRALPLYNNVPILVISMMTARNDVERAMELGANGYLMRPLRREDFEIVYLTYIQRKDAKSQS